jgi:hypothetical protein
MGDDLQITVIATGFDSARKSSLYGTATAAQDAGLAAGLENRDYMQELQRQRTAAGERSESEGQADSGTTREAVAVPISTGTPVAAGDRAAREAEDLDIPAFLRRSR